MIFRWGAKKIDTVCRAISLRKNIRNGVFDATCIRMRQLLVALLKRLAKYVTFRRKCPTHCNSLFRDVFFSLHFRRLAQSARISFRAKKFLRARLLFFLYGNGRHSPSKIYVLTRYADVLGAIGSLIARQNDAGRGGLRRSDDSRRQAGEF